MDDPESFGSWLRARRRARDLSRADLARRVSCAVITIKKIETGERRPSRQIAELILDVLAVPADERTALVHLARTTPAPAGPPPKAPALTPADLALDDLSGRAIRNYTLHERLGAGGFGVVYRAEQPGIGRAVAIKIILPQYANLPEFIRRFEAEAQIIARLEHPHIIPLYDYWREPGGTYLVMRYVAGGTLHATLERGPLSLDTVARVLEQVGAALAVAHRAGVVHRDLKPSNILLDSDGNAYLADFGIAKDVGNAEANDQTQAGMILGSPAYLSPEQIRDEPVTPLSDIYSLGIMLYELLTGAKPFQARTPAELLQKHINEELPPLRARRADLPEALEALIQRATAKNPVDRFPDVLTLVADFRRMIVPHGAAVPEAVPEGAVVGRLASEYATALVELPDLINPYKGLRSFTQADAAHFFGRDTLVAQLLERLAEEFFSQKAPGRVLSLAGDDGRETVDKQQSTTPRFLAVVGPSGSGKSSVVRAGLIPALRRGGVPGSEHWFVAELLPGTHPLEELELALLRVAADSTLNLAEQLGRDKRGLLRAARLVLPPDDESELLLVIDQFEELFTLVEDEAVRLHLLDSLVAAVCDERSRVRVVITLRADFMDRPLQYGDFGDLLRRQAEFVLPLMPDELERAIVGPAECAGLTLEPGLLAAIVRDVGEQPGTLPLVQYALTELFEEREGRMLTLRAYQASGGATGALARRAEEIYAGLTKQQQEAARQLFLRLISLGEGAEDTRRRVRLAELATTDHRPPTSDGVEAEPSWVVGRQSSAIDAVIDLYGRYRLLTFDRDPITRGPTVEIAHEALIRNWERLRDWLEASRDDLRVQRRLMTAASDWANAGRDASFLASGARLAQFAALVATGDPSTGSGHGLALNEAETAYVHASVAERERQEAIERERQARELGLQRRAANRLRYLVAVLALFLVGAIGLTTFAFNQRNIAERTARLASARELAASAISSLNRDPESSILLALQAVTTTYVIDRTVLPEAEQALHRAVQASHVRLTFADETSAVMTVAFSPDGTRLATINADGTAKVRDATTGNTLLTLPVHASSNRSRAFRRLAFSPDGTRLATCANERGVIVWNVASGQTLLTIPNSDELCSIIFSPDGTRLASGSGRGVVKLWDAATGKELLTLVGHSDAIAGVAFSSDGTRLATGSWDNTVRIWDVATGKALITLSSNSYVSSMAFSPDGTRLAAASGETTLSIWDAFSGKPLNQFTSLEPQVVAFSPDGARLAIGTFGGTVALLDAATGKELLTLAGHTDEVISVAFSPDGMRLATASLDKTAKMWDITADREVLTFSQPSVINRVAFSPDGTRLITGNDDSGVHVWDARTGQVLLTLSGHTMWVVGVAFSPDGTRIATASETAKVWDAASGGLLLTLPSPVGPVRGVAFSPDGTRIATASLDGAANIWDAATGKALLTLPDHGSWARSVAYSPDDTSIAVPYDDGTAKVWDAATGKEILTLSGHTGPIWAITYSSDSRRIATASVDRTAKVWDAATGKVLLTLSGHTGSVWSVAFSPDGTRIATASADKTVNVWDATTGKILHTLPGHTAGIYGVAFSPDGMHIATASGDGTARIYLLRVEELVALAKSRVTRAFTSQECQQYLHVDQCPSLP